MATPKARKPMSQLQAEKMDKGREMAVYKADEMIQKGRHQLSIQEQRCVLYAISKIKPTDTAFQEYTFDIKDFYDICGLRDESYTDFKAMLIGLKSKCWWMPLKDDPDTESAVSWFNKVKTNKKSGIVTIRFDDDMMPYLLELVERDEYFTGYNLRYILPMSCQYAPRLYELLKSYQKNNMAWFFEIGRLKRLLNAECYTDYNKFRRFALDPAVEEINTYTDLNIAYKEERGKGRGRPVERVTFYMFEKKAEALNAARMEGEKKLDGVTDYDAAIRAIQDDEDEKRIRDFIRENMKDE